METGLVKNRLIRIFKDNMSLRESADYLGSFSQESAFLSISNAQEFFKMALTLLRQQS